MKKILEIILLFLFVRDSYAEQIYRRVVSLAPSITESLYDLQCEGNVVGVTRFRPPRAASKTIVGDLQNIDYEKLLVIQPDIVLVKKDCTRPEVIRKIESLGFFIKVFPEDRSFEDICSQFMELGALMKKSGEAKRIIQEVRKEVSLLEEKRRGGKLLSVFWQVGVKPVIAAGGESFIDDLIGFAGMRNIFHDIDKPYFLVSAEEVLLRNPDAILYVSDMDDSDEAKVFWSPYPLLQAVKSNNIVSLDADRFCQPTPKRFVQALKSLIEITESLVITKK